ncbi:MAG: acylneuraminate cytidylyltransferase [Chlamydiales bacterium]|jgi:spore coat polysaccharide biosynthesis protein SpsF|nr:acylneuraminate cytidylyltransferase [Chlamydiales bacterium]
MDRTYLIVQARMSSTRLPGKVLKKVLGRPLLDFLIERLKRVRLKSGIVIATTLGPQDDPIVQLAEQRGVLTFRGSEEDVLERYYLAAQAHGAAHVVRITSDCPLIDPELIDTLIGQYHEAGVDYLSNVQERTFPRGMDCEVFSFAALEQAYLQATLPEEREHVTPYIHRHPELFSIKSYARAEDASSYRWTVDTPEDFQLIEKILEEIFLQKPLFTLDDLLVLLKKHPEWNAINQNIAQKNH